MVGLYKFMDAFGYTFTEVGKGSIVYGFNHPEYDFQYFFDFFIIFIYFVIAMMLISRLPYIIGTIYVIGFAIYKAIQWIYNKIKERKQADD